MTEQGLHSAENVREVKLGLLNSFIREFQAGTMEQGEVLKLAQIMVNNGHITQEDVEALRAQIHTIESQRQEHIRQIKLGLLNRFVAQFRAGAMEQGEVLKLAEIMVENGYITSEDVTAIRQELNS